MSDRELVFPAHLNGLAMGMVFGVSMGYVHDGFGIIIPLVALVLATYAYIKEKKIRTETAENDR